MTTRSMGQIVKVECLDNEAYPQRDKLEGGVWCFTDRTLYTPNATIDMMWEGVRGDL